MSLERAVTISIYHKARNLLYTCRKFDEQLNASTQNSGENNAKVHILI